MKKITLIFACVLLYSFAYATPYIPLDQITTHVGQSVYRLPETDLIYNHYFEFIQLAGFLQPLQYEFAGANFGGEREEEIGGMYNIVETDNTLEAILVWSRYYELTGDSQYNDEIQDAWIYAYQWPAWLEGAGYYSAHNCAWGLAAELKFREVFNDSTHWNYAVNCANYIVDTPLSFASTLNVMVTGWCAGNLYLYGEATGNDYYMQVAVQRGRQITEWVEENPSYRLGLESWAMSSGTFVWGICNSYFREDPVFGQEWLETYGPMVQVYEPSMPSWSNAWNVAYCNAQGGMYDVTGDPVYQDNHIWLTNYLLSKDSDADGGIPASAAGSTDADASWTSAYLAMMGCDRYCGFDLDAGIMLIRNPADHTRIDLGETVDVEIIVGNWGLQDAQNIMVVTVGAFQDTAVVDIPAGTFVRIEPGQWTPSVLGIDSVTVTAILEGDENDFNDSEVSRFMVIGPSDETDAGGNSLSAMPETFGLAVYPNPFNNTASIRYSLQNSADVTIRIFGTDGREVFSRNQRITAPGEHTLEWNPQDLASGVYFVSISAGSLTRINKVIYLK